MGLVVGLLGSVLLWYFVIRNNKQELAPQQNSVKKATAGITKHAANASNKPLTDKTDANNAEQVSDDTRKRSSVQASVHNTPGKNTRAVPALV
jgi:cytoskeletal protein RodZ